MNLSIPKIFTSGSLVLLAGLASVGISTAHEPSREAAVGEMATAATRFLQSLDASQEELAALPFKKKGDVREDWHFVPKDSRKGLVLSKMEPAQRHLARALIASGLSQRGYVTAATVMSLEAILAVMENDPVKRDTEKYYFTVFGDPAADATWAWGVEGHHLSLNFTIVDGEHISATPSFFGANPAEVREGKFKGLRALADDEERGRKLVDALLKAGKKNVIIADKAPNDVLTGGDRVAAAPEQAGITGAEMDDAQRGLLRDLVEGYVGRNRAAIAEAEMAAFDSTSPAEVRFAWAGGTERGQPQYYRVQTPVFLFEYANTQNDANHAHAVWRDLAGDFGRDLLGEHYKESHAEDGK